MSSSPSAIVKKLGNTELTNMFASFAEELNTMLYKLRETQEEWDDASGSESERKCDEVQERRAEADAKLDQLLELADEARRRNDKDDDMELVAFEARPVQILLMHLRFRRACNDC